MTSFAILPAAGRSRRMGNPKLLLPWDNTTVIGAALQAWRRSRVDHILVVVRGDDIDLQNECGKQSVQLVRPPVDPPQMKDSVIAALEWIEMNCSPHGSDAWLLAPADMPRLSAEVVDHLLANHDPKAPAILKPSFAGKHGHPVLFPWTLAIAVKQLPPDSGIDALSAAHCVKTIACDEASVLDDLDTPADYDLLRKGKPREED